MLRVIALRAPRPRLLTPIVAVLLAAGCGDRPPAERLHAPPPRAVADKESGTGAATSHISFDLTIQNANVGVPALRPAAVHVERVRAADGTWHTSLQFLDDAVQAPGALSGSRLASIDFDGHGKASVRRADGAEVPMADVAEVMTERFATKSRQEPSGMASALGALSDGHEQQTNWIDALIRTQSDCDREVAAVKTHGGADRRDAAGQDHYVLRGAHGTVDIGVDPAKGKVLSTVAADGTREVATTSDYVDGPGGIAVRRQLLIAHTNGSTQRTTTLTLSKVTIDGQEVVK